MLYLYGDYFSGGIFSDCFPKRYLHIIFYRLLISIPIKLIQAFSIITTDVNIAFTINAATIVLKLLVYNDIPCTWALVMDQFRYSIVVY